MCRLVSHIYSRLGLVSLFFGASICSSVYQHVHGVDEIPHRILPAPQDASHAAVPGCGTLSERGHKLDV